MKSLIGFVLCMQACLLQTVVCQCNKGAHFSSPAGYIAPVHSGSGSRFGTLFNGLSLADSLGNGALAGLGIIDGFEAGAFGGAGEGNVEVVGELPVAGNTAVFGQVPIQGAVRFCGDVQAAGSVTINGRCSCGCE